LREKVSAEPTDEGSQGGDTANDRSGKI